MLVQEVPEQVEQVLVQWALPLLRVRVQVLLMRLQVRDCITIRSVKG